MKPISVKIKNHWFYVGHGDGLGPGDRNFKIMKKVFTSKFFQWLFQWFHPDLGISLANFWSRKSRQWDEEKEDIHQGENEPLFNYSQQLEKKEHHDYYIFGHRHRSIEMKVNDQSVYINLGEWVTGSSYVEYDGKQAMLKTFSG